ncbi:MAG: hypothetical protein L0G94_07205 [Brachybacterium sp.]|uniref:hypothetical protein n=1 Tax=Brachybacterium sp. TaxID=1891286 RepID=UPI002649202B|nr:hypothetical protein [Brachybacterium sp.]MDN5686458.1 hypothetical protein [Brachybacterium sp.]
MSVWHRLSPAPVVRDTGWQTIQTAASGLAAQGPMDPIQFFRVRRIDSRVLVDLAGLRLDTEKAGLANLGQLPAWAAASIPQQYHWVNDHPTSLHPSVCAVHVGRTLYWTGQVIKGGIGVTRPEQLRGGFEYTTTAAFPHDLAPTRKEKPRWMP